MAVYYLRANNEGALYTALQTAGLVVKHYDPSDPDNIRPVFEGQEDSVAPAWEPQGAFDWVCVQGELDVVGAIYVPSGVTTTDADGVELAEMIAIEGFHANLLADLTAEQEALLPIIDAPATPQRTWALGPQSTEATVETEREVTGLTSNDMREVDPAAAGDGTLPPPLWADEESLGDENG